MLKHKIKMSVGQKQNRNKLSGTEAMCILDSISGSVLKQPGDFIVQENGKSQEPELPNVTGDQIQFWKVA